MTNSKYSYVISFDIGMLNLAFCIIRVEHPQRYVSITDWQLLNLGSKKAEECSRECIRRFKTIFKPLEGVRDTENVWVVIERQSPRNHQCLCISHAVFGYFLSMFKNIHVQFVSSSAKPLTSKGQKRKSESVRETQKWLEQNGEAHAEFFDWFKKQSKKEDLADAAMQAIYFADKITYYEPLPFQHDVIVISDSDDDE